MSTRKRKEKRKKEMADALLNERNKRGNISRQTLRRDSMEAINAFSKLEDQVNPNREIVNSSPRILSEAENATYFGSAGMTHYELPVYEIRE